MKTSTKLIRWASAIMILGVMVFNVNLMIAGGTTAVCHCTGQEAEETDCSIEIVIGQAAVDVHIAHGDYEGPCID